jgi:sugar phosphate isomerase/epimerase
MRIGVTAVMLPELDFPAQVELCVRLGIPCYQLRPRAIPEAERGKPPSPWGNHRFDLTPERLVKEGTAIAAALRAAGLEPWGTLPSACIDDRDDALKQHAEGAAVSGAGRVRIGPTPYPDRPFDYAAFLARVVDRYAAIVERITRPAGVKVLLETHCGTLVTSPGLARTLCAGFAPRDVGVILDVANYTREGGISPVLAVSVLRDWIDCVHIGGSRRVDAGVDGHGCRKVEFRSCPLDESDLNASEWLAAIALLDQIEPNEPSHISPPLIIEDFGDYADGAGRLARSAGILRRITGR